MNERPNVRVSDHRKAPPIGVKLAASLLRLGFTLDEIQAPGAIEWQHDPPLKERRWDDAAGDFDPPQHDPRFMLPMRKADHKAQTFGPGGEKRVHKRNSDISEPIRLDRLAQKHDAFKAMLAAPKKRKAERERSKWPSRPFQNQKRSK